jgi:putative transposase
VFKHRIDEVSMQRPFYSSRHISANCGAMASSSIQKAAQRYMRQMGIARISPGPNLSRRVQNERVPADLLRDVTGRNPTPVEVCLQPSTSHCGVPAEPVG